MSQTHATGSAGAPLGDFKAIVAEHRTWFIVLGILLIALGFVAIVFPFFTSITAAIFVGYLFLIGGGVQIVHAFSTKGWSEFALNLLLGVLYVLAGAYLAFYPLTGVVSLTLLLAFLFILEGVIEVGMAIRIRPREGWVWMLVSGIVAILAGAIIVYALPESAAWAIGLLVGINMMSTGWAYLFLAMAAGKKA